MILRWSSTSSWHVSENITRQQTTLRKHIADSQEATLSVSNELAAQKYLIQENSSWAQRLTNLLSWYVVELVHGFDSFRLNLLQLSVASN